MNWSQLCLVEIVTKYILSAVLYDFMGVHCIDTDWGKSPVRLGCVGVSGGV